MQSIMDTRKPLLSKCRGLSLLNFMYILVFYNFFHIMELWHLSLKNPAYCHNRAVIGWRCIFYAGSRVACVDNGIIACIDGYMACIADNIAWLHAVAAYAVSYPLLCVR